MRSIVVSALLILALWSVGCGPTSDLIVTQPEAPVLIGEVKGKLVRVFAYDKAGRRMVEVGMVPLAEYVGWTLTKFDWEARIERDKREGDADGDAGTNGSRSP